MNNRYKKKLSGKTYKKQLMKIIWSIVFLIAIITAKNIEAEKADDLIVLTNKIVNYDLNLNDKRIINMKRAITSFSIKIPVKEYSIPMQGTLYKKFKASKTGIDIVAYDQSVRSIGNGEVISIDEKDSGTDITVRHGDLEAVYGNMEKINVKNGDKIFKDHILGSMGDISKKNKYFHFEIWKDGARVDPLEYIKANNQTPLSYE